MAAEFHLGGHVPSDSPAYVERDFVNECFSELSRGAWVVLLGPRQHGKTSGLLRLLSLLRDADVKAAHVSLQGIPEVDSYPGLLEWIAGRIASQFDVDLVPPPEEQAAEVEAWLARALPAEASQVVVMLDEAAGVRDPEMRSMLYHQLRRLHDERDSPAVENLGRSFAMLFSGTFEPARLVADDLTSPFNVSRRIETRDLTREDVHALADQVGAQQAAPYADRAYDLVGGQPLLIQVLLDAAERGDVPTPAEERFEAAKERLLAGNSDHLIDLFSSVVGDKPVREIAEQVLHNDEGAPSAATVEHRMLVTVGLARIADGRLLPRNALYAKVGSEQPLLSGGRDPAPGVKVAAPGADAFDFVSDLYLRDFAREMVEAGYAAFNSGNLRLGLIGLGSGLEAILIDVLEQATPTTRDDAKRRAKPNFSNPENENDPNTWRLVNLVKVADKLPALKQSPIAAAHALRELRNFVHPAVGRAAGHPQSALQGEFNAAQGVLTILLRELS